MIKINHLSVFYDRRQALRDINLKLDPGQILAVIGPNGAGKTTLVRAISGVVPLSGGIISINGDDLSALSPLERARKVAVVPQARNLPAAFTAWETVLLGRTPHLNFFGQLSSDDERIARLAMQKTDTLDLADRRLGELSGGEQQRLLLARAMAQHASILLLDEPVTHLDLHYQLDLMDQISSLARSDSLCVLAVLHDLNLASRYADRVALLVKGELMAYGKTGEILVPDILSKAYNLPMDVFQGKKGGRSFITPAILQ